MKTDYPDILNFWFTELNPKQWFTKDDDLDSMIRKRFLTIHQRAERGELSGWRSTPEGRLAEIIVLDQFSRNIFRGRPEAFKNDPVALVLAQEIVLLNLDVKLDKDMRAFAYMPFMHSESKKIHEDFFYLFQNSGNEELLKFEALHKDIIDQFGRYPHRNDILSRNTTDDEKEFLQHHKGF